MRYTIREQLEEIAFLENNAIAKVAKYMLNAEEVMNVTVTNILKDTQVTSPTPTRLAQKLGLSGFSQLKVLLDIQNKREIQSKEEIRSKNLKEYEASILETFNIIYNKIEEKQIKRIAKLINSTTKTIFLAEGSNVFFLQELSFKLRRLKKIALAPIENHDKFIHVHMLQEQDVCFAISLSGTTKSTMDLVAQAKKSGCKVILITTNNSKEFTEVDEVIFIDTNEELRQINNMKTRLAIISLLDLLYINILNLDFEENIKNIKNTRIRNTNIIE